MYAAQILSAPLSDFSPVVENTDRPMQAVWEWGDSEVEIGIWECTPGRMDGTNGDFDEMMVMASGRVTVKHGQDTTADGTYDIAPGTLWATPRGWECTWDIHETVRKLYVIDHRPGSSAPAIHIANAHTMLLGEPTPRPNPVAGNPLEASTDIWAHNQLEIGVWEGTQGSFEIIREGYDEVFLCLSGAATLTGTDGSIFDIGPGTALLTKHGFRGTWNITETVRKVYCIVNRR